MAVATLDHARSVTADIIHEIDPLCVVVFGGVARTGFGADVDLLIVVDDAARCLSEQRLRRIVTNHTRWIAVDPFLVSARAFADSFRAGSPFLNAVVREGRVLYVKDAERRWTQDAREELDAARYLSGGGYHRASCYHAQQAVEKHLKGTLLAKGWELEKIHSIGRLAALCGDYGITVRLPDEDIVFLDSIYRGRYPGEAGLLPHGDPNADDSQRALAIAASVVG